MKNLRPFQIVLLGASVFIFIFAIATISLYTADPEVSDEFPFQVQIWGTLDWSTIEAQINQIAKSDDRFSNVQYRAFSESQFQEEFVNALADGGAPDLIILPHELLIELRSKLFGISYEFYTQRTIRDTFVEGADIFALNDGLYALPFAVDPLVMYWNRDILSSNNIALPPTTWEQVRNDTVPRLSRVTATRDILQSGVAFGEYRNVRNAQEVLALLMMQSGSNMVTEVRSGYRLGFDESTSGGAPATAALNFYTEFSNPLSSLYSWNRSLPEDRSRFLSGDLALYFGYGSELDDLENANPNLNFDMAEVPQGADASVRRGYGRFYGFAIPKAARDTGISYIVAEQLGSLDFAPDLAEVFNFAPVHRVAVFETETDPYQIIRNQAAGIAQAWLSPEPELTENAFRGMVDDIASGRLGVSQSIRKARDRLELGY